MTFRLTLLIILALELFSFITNWLGLAQFIGFFVLLTLIFALSLKNLKYGVFAAIIELIIGSKGHLLAISMANFTISLRMGIFAVVMLGTLIYIIRKRKLFAETIPCLTAGRHELSLQKYYFIFSAFLIWGVVWALIRNNSLSLIFNDFNAFLYFLYIIPFALVLRNSTKEFWQIFAASIAALCLKTLILIFTFSHYLDYTNVYKWIRTTGWGELAFVPNETFRLFSQSHIFALIGFVIFLVSLLQKKYIISKNKLIFITGLCASCVIISLSRSLWVALAGTAVFFLIYIIKNKWGLKKISQTIGIFILFLAIGFALVQTIIVFPCPKAVPIDTQNLFRKRFDTSEAAAASRWTQLPELGKAIAKHPIVGSGFGTTATYKSFDPRIMTEQNPEGVYTTHAFEWAYLDLILKIGLAGLIAYLILIYKIGKHAHSIHPALTFGLIALLLTHIFTPYINHPLGIGYLLLLAQFYHHRKTVPTKRG